MSESVLEFRAVDLDVGPQYDTGMKGINFYLREGECILICLEQNVTNLPLADAAMGLVPADAGTIHFRGKPWSELSADAQAAARGVIGRVFYGSAWISNLSVEENVLVAQRHHTRRPEKELKEEAEDLARSVGLDIIPTRRPAWVNRAELMKSQWIRSLLGKRTLLIFEQPTARADDEDIRRFVELVSRARERGSAVLWLTSDMRVWNNSSLSIDRRYTMLGTKMQETGGSGI
ncbi:MAG: hypothetical protein KJ626_08555 [Verrucomicrobia bacterium]|nr:hypothetical protein [Verrucomicrobiota bacterium]